MEDRVEGENSNIIPMDGGYGELKACIEAILEEGAPPVVKKRTVVSIKQQASQLNDILVSLHAESRSVSL